MSVGYCFLQYAKYITVCLFVMFLVSTLFCFYTYVHRWYVCYYSVGLAKCVSLLIMGVLCVCLRFYFFTGDVYAVI
jgi:hypothetical protein